MTPLDLLAQWPGWADKTADELIALPAWSMPVRWGDEEMRMRFTDNPPRDVIALRIAFDGEEHFLGIGNREVYPDLHRLWTEKQRLPDALVLALVEKECGTLLQLLENAVRRQLTVLGAADPAERSEARGLEVVSAQGDIVASFVLTVSPAVRETFGDLANIDPAHPDIRALPMPAFAQYAAFELGDASAAVAPGDALLLPEADEDGSAKWILLQLPQDGLYHVVAADRGTVSFGDLADGHLPPVPAPNALALVRDGKRLAVGRFARLGIQPAFSVEEVL